tara:strand:- start:621 stop:2387 length:1767 start_codon:yes stop_codon:yes gene_type:complete
VQYVEIAIGHPRHRGRLVAKSDLIKYLKPEIPLFRSVYLYDKHAFEYSEEYGGLKNYFGERSIDNIVLDIDKGDNSNELTLSRVQDLLGNLLDEGLHRSNLQVYFSGSGYHISIPNSVFEFQPSDSIQYVVKNTLKKLFPQIDHSIYMRTGIYRVQHTINKKTNLYKIPLDYSEVYKLKPEQIMELATSPRTDYPYSELVGNGQLSEHKIVTTGRVKVMNNTVEPRNVVPCVQTMLDNGPVEGARNQTLLRIASHFHRHGIPSEFAKVAIKHWNNNSLDENELIEKVEYVYNRGYKYGCRDTIMSKYCQTRCIYYQRKDYTIDVMSSDELQADLHNRLTTDFSGRCIPLADMLGLEQNDTVVYPGELVTLFGPTGSSKTTLAQCIALGVDFANDDINPDWQMSTLFLSLELSAWYMHRRHLQIVSGLDKDTVTQNYEELYNEHKHKLGHVAIQTVSPTLDQIQTKIRELQPSIVVIDYIDLIETPNTVRGEYEKIKYISHNLSNMAVNMDTIIIQISQVSREYSRNEVLDLYAGKGSGAIENASRKVIGLNGRANSSEKEVSMFKNTDGELFDVKLEWQPSFRLRRPE